MSIKVGLNKYLIHRQITICIERIEMDGGQENKLYLVIDSTTSIIATNKQMLKAVLNLCTLAVAHRRFGIE